jgi:MscS family membrane protein
MPPNTDTAIAAAAGGLNNVANNVWQTEYYGNTVQTWVSALVIILLSILLGKAVYWVFSGIARKLAARTETKLDDIIIDLVEEPVVASIMASGIWFGLMLLSLPGKLGDVISKSYSVLIWLLIGWVFTRLFDAFYKHVLQPWAEKSENDLDDQLLPIAGRGVKMIIWVLAIIVGLNNAGYDVGAMIAGLGIGGLALAMAAKDTVSNVFGGFTIFTDKPFRLNDRIRACGFDGTVNEIGVRSTRLTTLSGTMVTIPNAKFSDAPVENVTAEPCRKITVNIGLTYDMSADKMQEAMDTLRAIAEAHDDTEEKIITVFNAFNDFAMNILFIYYIKKDGDIGQTQTDINLEILKQFGEKGLDMAFPTQTIYNVQG